MSGRKPSPNPKKRRTPRKPPAGTRLTEDQKRLIISASGAGANDYVAAGAARISPRSFRELRQRAEGRHPTRRSTPALKQFFAEVDEAIAQFRMRQEIEIAQKDPKHWLKYRARSKPGLDGWTEPVPDEPEADQPLAVTSVEDLEQIVSVLVASGAVSLPPCEDPSCACSWHRPSDGGGGDDEGR
jgi:hypothetical protein